MLRHWGQIGAFRGDREVSGVTSGGKPSADAERILWYAGREGQGHRNSGRGEGESWVAKHS